MTNHDTIGTNGAAPGPDRRRRQDPKPRAAIYSADTWHGDDGVASVGSGRPLHHNPVRRVFTAD